MKDRIKKLNEILEDNYNAYFGYEEAIELVESPTLKRVFHKREEIRKIFIYELTKLIKKAGEEPVKKGTFTGKAHNIYMRISAELSDFKQQKVIEECIDQDENLLDEYKDILNETGLNEDIVSTITSHIKEIEQTVVELKKLHQQGKHEEPATVSSKTLSAGR